MDLGMTESMGSITRIFGMAAPAVKPNPVRSKSNCKPDRIHDLAPAGTLYPTLFFLPAFHRELKSFK